MAGDGADHFVIGLNVGVETVNELWFSEAWNLCVSDALYQPSRDVSVDVCFHGTLPGQLYWLLPTDGG